MPTAKNCRCPGDKIRFSSYPTSRILTGSRKVRYSDFLSHSAPYIFSIFLAVFNAKEVWYPHFSQEKVSIRHFPRAPHSEQTLPVPFELISTSSIECNAHFCFSLFRTYPRKLSVSFLLTALERNFRLFVTGHVTTDRKSVV